MSTREHGNGLSVLRRKSLESVLSHAVHVHDILVIGWYGLLKTKVGIDGAFTCPLKRFGIRNRMPD